MNSNRQTVMLVALAAMITAMTASMTMMRPPVMMPAAPMPIILPQQAANPAVTPLAAAAVGPSATYVGCSS